MALMISLVAVSIDAMLPALPKIGADLGVAQANHNQLVISAFFFGFAAGQMVYGPISDSVGRKPVIYAGLALFMFGCVLSIFATDYTVMLIGRVIQGIGVAAPRTVSIALIRDQYEGPAMARIMSFIMAVFILMPAMAPALGQAVLALSNWRMIFVSFLLLSALVIVWFAVRQPETLSAERRAPFSLRHIAAAIVESVTNRPALEYMLAAGLVFGAFVGYLTSAQQIFQDQYGLGALFPAFFAVLALAIGAASIVNARLVMRLGMHLLALRALATLTSLSCAFFAVAAALAGHPPLWALMAYGMVTFFCMGILFGNLTAMAMEPLGHIAGVAAAVIGSMTTFISLALGSAVGLSYNGTVLPLVGGFALLGMAAFGLLRWSERGR